MRFLRSTHGSRCRECPLRGSREVPAIGPGITSKPWSGLVLVGESPGQDEVRLGEPFVGRAGGLLNSNLRHAGLIRERLWITNLIGCRPPHDDLGSETGQEALECCRPGLEAELGFLDSHGAKVYIPLGTRPLSELGISGGITLRRGYVYESSGRVLIPSYHPSYLVRGNFEEVPTQVSDFKKASRLAISGWQVPRPKFITHPTLSQMEAFSRRVVRSKSLIALDIETTSLIPERGKIIVVGLADGPESAISFPFLCRGGSRYLTNGAARRAREALARVLEACPVMVHNATFDPAFLRSKRLPVKRVLHDTLLLHHAIHPELPHRLSYVASVYDDIPYWKDTLEDKESATIMIPDERLREYNLWDAVVLHRILPPMLKDAEALGVRGVYETISIPLIEPVLEMTRVGVGFDREAQGAWEKDLKAKEAEIESRLREGFGLPPAFNFASGPHLEYMVFSTMPASLERAKASYEARLLEIDLLTRERDSLRLKAERGEITTKLEARRLVSLEGQVSRKVSSQVFTKSKDLAGILTHVKPIVLPRGTTRRKTEKGSVSLDDESIQALLGRVRGRVLEISGMKRPPQGARLESESLSRSEAFLTGVLELREASKLRSTYGDFETWQDGRVHFPYKMAGTATGRLSSGDKKSLGVGNAQNIPKEGRKLFIPDPGHVLLGADYASLEPRMIAYLSHDEEALRDFASGVKVYDAIIRDVLGIPKDDPRYQDIRDAIKVYVLGTNYGGSIEGVYAQMRVKCKNLPFTLKDIRGIHEARLKLHPGLREWGARTRAEVLEKRVLQNAFGRRRVFLGSRSSIPREALDYGPQSSGADLVNQAMIRLHARLGKETPRTHIILQLHDALYLEAPWSEARKAAKALVEEMERPVQVLDYENVVFPVELAWSEISWGDMKEVGSWRDIPTGRASKNA